MQLRLRLPWTTRLSEIILEILESGLMSSSQKHLRRQVAAVEHSNSV
jgi:hypothetical protein